MLDTIAPGVQDAGVQSGTTGANGWYVSAVIQSFHGRVTAARVSTRRAPRASRRTSRRARSRARRSRSRPARARISRETQPRGSTARSFKIDLTDPTAMLAVTAGMPGTNGWYTSDVTVTTSGVERSAARSTARRISHQTAETTGAVFNGLLHQPGGSKRDSGPADGEARQDRPIGGARRDGRHPRGERLVHERRHGRDQRQRLDQRPRRLHRGSGPDRRDDRPGLQGLLHQRRRDHHRRRTADGQARQDRSVGGTRGHRGNPGRQRLVHEQRDHPDDWNRNDQRPGHVHAGPVANDRDDGARVSTAPAPTGPGCPARQVR